MKKSILLAVAVVVTSAAMVSCKKEYVCKCTKTYTTGTGSTTENYSTYTFKENRKRAEDRCNEQTGQGSDIWGDYSINCQIQ